MLATQMLELGVRARPVAQPRPEWIDNFTIDAQPVVDGNEVSETSFQQLPQLSRRVDVAITRVEGRVAKALRLDVAPDGMLEFEPRIGVAGLLQPWDQVRGETAPGRNDLLARRHQRPRALREASFVKICRDRTGPECS